MPTNKQASIAIIWTSDLKRYRDRLVFAIAECAKVLPGIYHVIGIQNVTSPNTSADALIRQAVYMDENLGWVIKPVSAVRILSETVKADANKRYDLIIALTRQKICDLDICDSMYEFCKDYSGIISLEACESECEYGSFTASLLTHVVGRALLNDGVSLHCNNSDCAMASPQPDRLGTGMTMDFFASPNHDIFCNECLEKLRESPFWSEEPPTIVFHTSRI